jgi:hypothetical protein
VLLSRYVTPVEIRQAGLARLVNHMLKAGRLPRPHIEHLAEQALTAAKAQQLTLPGERLAAELVHELAQEALAVRERLARLDAELEQTLTRHPDAALIRSLPGMGARHHQAIIALARRRADVLHAILRTHQPHQPDHTKAA